MHRNREPREQRKHPLVTTDVLLASAAITLKRFVDWQRGEENGDLLEPGAWDEVDKMVNPSS